MEELIPGLPNDIAMDCLIKVPHRHHSRLRAVCHDWRSHATSPSFYHHRRLSCVAEPLICFIQSLATELLNSGKSKNYTPKSYGLTLYNCFTGAWHRHPAITVPIFAQCIAVGDKIILLGGWDSTTLDAICDVHIVDVVTGECRRGKPMSTPTSFFACAAIGSLLYVAGGHDNQKNALKTAEVYDPAADEWRQLPPMLEERDECQGIAIGGKFLVISGYNTDNQGIFRRGGECYDPVNRTWEKQDDSLWGNSNDDNTDVSSSVLSPRSVCFVLPKASGADEEEEKGLPKFYFHHQPIQFSTALWGSNSIMATLLRMTWLRCMDYKASRMESGEQLGEDGASKCGMNDEGMKRKAIEEEEGNNSKAKRIRQSNANIMEEDEDDHAHIQESPRNRKQARENKTISKEEQQDMLHMIKSLKDQLSRLSENELALQSDEAMSPHLLSQGYPIGWKRPKLPSYNGKTDLEDHFHSFITSIEDVTNKDNIWCKMFRRTLREYRMVPKIA